MCQDVWRVYCNCVIASSVSTFNETNSPQAIHPAVISGFNTGRANLKPAPPPYFDWQFRPKINRARPILLVSLTGTIILVDMWNFSNYRPGNEIGKWFHPDNDGRGGEEVRHPKSSRDPYGHCLNSIWFFKCQDKFSWAWSHQVHRPLRPDFQLSTLLWNHKYSFSHSASGLLATWICDCHGGLVSSHSSFFGSLFSIQQ